MCVRKFLLYLCILAKTQNKLNTYIYILHKSSKNSWGNQSPAKWTADSTVFWFYLASAFAAFCAPNATPKVLNKWNCFSLFNSRNHVPQRVTKSRKQMRIHLYIIKYLFWSPHLHEYIISTRLSISTLLIPLLVSRVFSRPTCRACPHLATHPPTTDHTSYGSRFVLSILCQNARELFCLCCALFKTLKYRNTCEQKKKYKTP